MSTCIPAGAAFGRLIQLSSTLLQRGCAAPEGALPRPGSCRQTFGGMGFVPAGSSIFPGRVTAQDNSGLIGRGGGGIAPAGVRPSQNPAGWVAKDNSRLAAVSQLTV